MITRLFVALIMTVYFATSAQATIRYADNTLASNCTSGNYSIANRACNGTDGDAYNTPAGVIAPTVAGDTIYVRAGTWTQQWDFQLGNKSGTVGNYITLAGYPGERPIFRYNGTATFSYGAVKVRGNRGYFIFRNFIYDGIDQGYASGWQIRDGNHHFILEDFELKNVHSSGFLGVNSNNITFRNCSVHDLDEDITPQRSRRYGFYPGTTDSWTIENCDIYNNPGGGIATNAVATTSNLIIRYNRIHHNGVMDNSSEGGITIYNAGGSINNTQIYGNVVYENGLTNPARNPNGIRVSNGATNTKVWNNVFYGNKGYGINVQSSTTTGTSIMNNIVVSNGDGQVINAGTGTVLSNNGCLAGDSCGATGKVTLSTATVCFRNAGSDDYRLVSGTNPCVDAGTEVAALPDYVGLPDIGAYERGVISQASSVSGFVEVVVQVANAGLLPTTGITGFSAACVGCTGSPIVVAASVKANATNVVQLTLSGITVAGTCSVTLSSSPNLTDGLLIGGSTGSAQIVNSGTVTTTSNCQNTSGTPTGSNPIAYYKLNEGSGTNANDETANNNDGTVSAGITWPTVYSGTGLRIPTDATYRHLAIPFGSGRNLTTSPAATCAIIKPDTQYSQKVVFSSSDNGTSQRFYFGWATVGGQLQWGMGIQGSGFFTGSEFPVTAQLTFVCITADAATDTAYLWVNKVKGTQSGKSVKTYTSYTLAGNFRYGNDGTNTGNNGGFDVDEVYVWDTLPTDADIIALYDALFPAGASTDCYKQQAHQWQRIYQDSTASPETIGVVNGEVEAVAGGAVALVVQLDCVGAPGAALGLRPYASADGSTYALAPDVLGTSCIALWGSEIPSDLNYSAVPCCLNGSLIANTGVTVLEAAARPTIILPQNNSYTVRYIFLVADLPNTNCFIKIYQDNGAVLAGGYTVTPAIRIKPLMASTGFF